MIFMFLAQAVLTLRYAFLGSDCFVLITVERDRISAVTRKNQTIASCFGVIAVSQFVLGLYMTAYATKAGCDRRPQSFRNRRTGKLCGLISV